MDTRHYKMIVEVARSGNLTRAARNLFLTQSALSHQLKEMESAFGSRLFVRDRRRMVLTQQGKLVLEMSDEILNRLEEAKRKVKTLNDDKTGEIRISTQCHLSYCWISSFMREFRKLHPAVEITVLPEATYQSIEYLLDRKIDIAITDRCTNKKVRYETLFTDELLVVVSDEHPWVNRKWVEPEQFVDETYLMYDIPSERSSVYRFLFGDRSPKKVTRFRMTEVLIEMVKSGIGVAVLPTWVVLPFMSRGGLATLRLTRRGYRRTWYAAMLPGQETQPFMRDFARLLSTNMKKSEAAVLSELM